MILQKKRIKIQFSSMATHISKLEIPASQVFLSADVQLLGISLAGTRMPFNTCHFYFEYSKFGFLLLSTMQLETNIQIFDLYFALYHVKRPGLLTNIQRSFFDEFFCINVLSLYFDFSKHLWSNLNVGPYGLYHP